MKKFKLLDPSKKCEVGDLVTVIWYDCTQHDRQILSDIMKELNSENPIGPTESYGRVLKINKELISVAHVKGGPESDSIFESTMTANMIWDIKVWEEKK